MYEESLRMPFLVRYPREIAPGSVAEAMVLNVDFAPTFLDWAGVPIPRHWQGQSLREIARGHTPDGWRTAMYYRYWMHMDAEHQVWAHYGIRTLKHKLIYYYGEALGTSGSTDLSTPKTWELFDLEADPYELVNRYDDPAKEDVRRALTADLDALQRALRDTPYSEQR
jgi:arylsulfatase A-like enzyme